MTSRFVATAIAFAELALMCGPANARPLQISDTRRVVALEEPAMARDGRHVAFITIASDFTHATYAHTLWTIDVRTGTMLAIARGRDIAVPRWSPDGKTLAYLARVAPQNHWQIALRDERGVERVVTHALNDVNDFAWSPDGRTIAFTAYDAPDSHDYFEVGDNDYTQTSPVPPVHLWVVHADGTGTRRLTHGAWTVAPTDPGGIFTSEFAWSTDGKKLIYAALANAQPGDDEFSTIHALDVAGGASAKLTSHTRSEFAPIPGPRGVIYSYPLGGDVLAENALHLLAPQSDRIISRRLDRNIGGATWLPDGRSVLACGDDGPHSVAWRIGLDGTVKNVALGRLNITCDSYSSSTFDAGIAAAVASDGGIAFVATTASSAPELYYMRSIADRPRRLTHFNAWLAPITLGKMTQFHWSGPKGEPENGVLTFPPNMRAGKRYPLVVFPHGGPGMASIDTFVPDVWPEAHLIASRGYIVFQPNYRGGDDHGNAFMLAIEGDTVRGPADDIMSGVDAVKKLPSVDSSRVAVCGWSYGGLLTSWLVTQYHNWKAAVAGAAVNDETEEYYLSITNVQNRYYLKARPLVGGGSAVYADQSPLTYAAQITTPMLIWSTTGDSTVPTTMSYSMYHALRDNHRTVRFVEFVAPTHGPSNPRNMEEITKIWLDWLSRYLQ